MQKTIPFIVSVLLVVAMSTAIASPALYQVIPDSGSFTRNKNNCGGNYNLVSLISSSTSVKVDTDNEEIAFVFNKDERPATEVYMRSRAGSYGAPRPTRYVHRPAYGFWRSPAANWVLVVKVGQEHDKVAALEISLVMEKDGAKCYDKWRGFGKR